MSTYRVQLDGVLSTTNTTEGPIALAMYDQLYNFLIGNSSSLGTQLIAFGGGQSYVNQRITAIGGGNVDQFGGPRGCPGPLSVVKGTAEYRWDVSHTGDSGKWFCIRFASASVPFDVLVHYHSGAMTRTIRPTAAFNTDHNQIFPTQAGYRTNIEIINTVFVSTSDCGTPGDGSDDVTIYNTRITGSMSSFTEGDYTSQSRTGFYYLGSRTTTDTRVKGGALSIQIAQRADGSGSWGLGTGSQTGYFLIPATEYASASLMVPNALYQWSSGSSTLGVFPISNATPGGFHITSSKNMFPIIPDRGTAGTWNVRYHLYANQDNLFIVTSDATTTSSYRFCYFGKYMTMKDMRPNYPWTQQVPYVFLATLATEGNEPTVPVTNSIVDGTWRVPVVWGTWQGNDAVEGGSWYPSASLGVSSCMLELPCRSRVPEFNPNKMVFPFAYDRYSFGLWLTGSAARSHPGISYLGRIGELLAAISGRATHDQTSDLKYAIVGNTATDTRTAPFMNSPGNSVLRQKMVIPWNGTTLIGSNTTAGGLTGSITI